MDVVDFYPGIQEILCPTTKRMNITNELPTTKIEKQKKGSSPKKDKSTLCVNMMKS
jgi:hypothetical protein